MRTEPLNDRCPRRAVRLLAASASLLVAASAFAAEPIRQRAFASPDDAVSALVAAAKSDDTASLLGILGPEGRSIIASGDAVADRSAHEGFAADAMQHSHLETVGDDFAVLSVGNEDWPFPIPLVKKHGTWHFDTAAGKNELLNRRIGRNELSTIEVCGAYVQAQRDYARRAAGTSGVAEYAQRFRSTHGKRDGLYWEAAAGEEESPMGPLAAEAAREGYGRGDSAAGPRPFHGYVYRILTAQGPHAPGGERSYVTDGRMTGGFALVAYPVDYGTSGIMTFVVNQQGIVFQKNLGKNTPRIAAAMARYDPDDSWQPTD